MIGLNIRSFHHLKRMVGNHKTRKIFFKRENNAPSMGEVFITENSDGYTCLYLYSNVFSGRKPNPSQFGELSGKISELNNKWASCTLFTLSQKDLIDYYNSMVSDIILLPEDFEEQYAKFCGENKKAIENIERKYADRNNEQCKYLFSLTEGSKNYFFWAVPLRFSHHVKFCQLEEIMHWAHNYSQLIKNVKHGTITAYTNYNSISDLVKQINELRKNKRVNDVINSFNTSQKKLLREVSFTDRDLEALSKFGKLSVAKRINFIQKMSTIEDANEILKQMKYVVNVHFEWNKEAFINYVTNTENLHAEILNVSGNIILVKVNDYDAVKYLGKSTNWCISKNKTYWNQYLKNGRKATQYMIFDFSKPEDDKYSIIGFTSIFNRGITNAHDFNNNDLMSGTRIDNSNNIASFIGKFQETTGIFSILKKDGIDVSDVTEYEKFPYKWNRESFFDELNKYVSKENYDVICDDGNKVAIIVTDSNIKDFLGKRYKENTNRDTWVREHIIFADFNKSEVNPERLVFGIVSQDEERYESFVTRLYNGYFETINSSFNFQLAKFNLPYDIICRTDDPVTRFSSAIENMEYPIAKQLIDDENVKKAISNEDLETNSDRIYSTVWESLSTYYSLDFINLLTTNGHYLSEFMGDEYANEIVKNIFMTMKSMKNGRFANMNLPNDELLRKFETNDLKTFEETVYVGFFKALMAIFESEKGYRSFINIIGNIMRSNNPTSLHDLIISIFLEKVRYDIVENDDTYSHLASLFVYCLHNKCEKSKAVIYKHRDVWENTLVRSAASINFSL